MVFPVIMPFAYFALMEIYGNFTVFQQKYQEFKKGAIIISSKAIPQIKR